MSPRARTGKHREHRPFALGPRIFPRGQFWACDARPWGNGKPTLRRPTDPRWPKGGDRLPVNDPASEALARQWAWSYTDQDETRARAQGRKLKRPLRATVDAFMAHREAHVSPNTVSNNRSYTDALVREIGAAADTNAITAGALQSIVDRMAGQGYKPATLRTARAVWHAFFKWGKIEPNPCAALRVPPTPRKELHAFDEAQTAKLRDAADTVDAARRHPLARLLFELGIATGCRASELRALRWEDFDPGSETVRIYRQQEITGRGERPTKGKRGRTALVLQPWWRDWHRPEACGLVLHDAKGRPISDTLAADLMRRITDKAGVAGTLHDLRRTYGRRFILARGTLDQLKYALGHRSIRTTEEQYAAVRDEDIMQAARALMGGGPRLLP